MALAPFIAPSSAFDRRTLGKYEVLCRLSAGGMSEIFLAYQKGLAGFRKVVVLKSILPDIRGEEEFVRMFLDEAKTTAAFNHPNIAQVFDLDVDEGTLFLAMEFVQGCTLVEMARACRLAKEPIPIGLTLTAVRDTALALHYAHSFTDPRGRRKVVIHRDVAEKNIMVTYEGTTKLLDFGIAKAVGGAHRTTVGMVKGTSGYMSPEQIRGEELDPRSDLFSLGVVMHECLTGMRLFHGKNAEEGMLAALREEVVPPSKQNSHIPPAVDAVVLKALRRHRDDRFTTALEFARAIEKAGAGLLWHPEQIGDLVQRYFTDRREQTRGLIEQAQASGDPSGEIRIDKLLAMQTRPPTNSLRLAAPPPKVSAPPPPSPPAPARASVPPPVASHPAPFPRQATPAQGGALHKKPSTPGISPPPALRALQNQERLVTPVVTTIPPHLQASYSAGESTKEVTSPSSSFATPSDDLLDNDENDVGVKTVIADVSPVGPQRHSPANDAVTADGQSAIMAPASSQMLTPLARPSMPGARPTQPAQPRITEPAPEHDRDEDEDEDDSPALKTTLALPFPPQRSAPSNLDAEPKTASDVVTNQYQPRFNPVTVTAVGAGVLAVLLLIMAVLRIGFFGGTTTNPPEVTLDTTVYSNSSKARQPNKAPTPKAAPKAMENPVEKPVEKVAPPVVVAPPPEPVPAPLEVAPAEATPAPVVKAPMKSVAAPVRRVRTPKKVETAGDEPELEDVVVPGKAFGDLTLATEPSGVVVIHNGRELGTTPLVKARMPVGKQTLKLKGPTGESKSLTFEMRANETKSLRVDLEDL